MLIFRVKKTNELHGSGDDHFHDNVSISSVI